MYLLYINAAPTDNCYCPDLQLETSTSNFPASLHQNSQAHGCHPHHCAARTLDEERTAYFPEACFASRRHPSCKRSVSTSWAGRWTYLTVEPRMKTFFTDRRCGYRSGSLTLTFASLRFKNWSADCNVPVMQRSFFNSTVTRTFRSTSVREKEKKSMPRQNAQCSSYSSAALLTQSPGTGRQ